MGTQLLFWLIVAGLVALAVYLVFYRKIIMGVRKFCSAKDSIGKWRIVQTFSGKYGVIRGFKYIIEPEFDTLVLIQDFFLVKKHNRRGLIDLNGEVILPPIYKEIYSNGDGLPQKAFFTDNVRVKDSKHEGVFNVSARKWIVPLCFTHIELIHSEDSLADLSAENARVLVEVDESLWGVYNIDTQTYDIPLEYDDISVYGYGKYVLLIKDMVYSLVRMQDLFEVKSAEGKDFRYVDGYFQILQNRWEKFYCDMELVRKEIAKKELTPSFDKEYVDAYEG